MRQKWKNGVPLAALIHERLAAAERCAGSMKEAEDEIAGFGGVDLAVGLFLCPTCAGNKKEFGVWADGLLILLRFPEAADGGADWWQLNCNLFDLCWGGVTGKGCVSAGVEEQEPGAQIAAENCFDSLTVKPAGCFDSLSAADAPDVQASDVRVDEAAEPMG